SGQAKPGQSIAGWGPLNFSDDGSLPVDNYGTVFDSQDGKPRYAVTLSRQRPQALFTGSDPGRLVYPTDDSIHVAPMMVLVATVNAKTISRDRLQQFAVLGLRPRPSDSRLIWLYDTFGTAKNTVRPESWFTKAARRIPWVGNRRPGEPDNHGL